MICNQGVYDPDFVFVAPRVTWTSDPNWLEDEFEMAATDRKIDIGVLDLFQIRDGMLIEHWALLDNLGMLKQLGAMK